MARGRNGVLVLAVVSLIGVVASASALAAGGESGGSSEGLPSSSELGAAIKPVEQDGPPFAELTDSTVAAELPLTELGREEVLDLLEGVFEPVLQGAAGPFDDLEAEELIGEHAAILAGDERPEPVGLTVGGSEESSEGKVLLESTLPVSRQGEVVDLGLEEANGGYESVNPIVDVTIPASLDEGIGLPEAESTIELVDAPEGRAPSINESTAVYPNVAPDTDLVVAPTPTGVETMTTLRSPAAPRSQSFHVDLPEGAELRKADGGAEVVNADGDVEIRIQPPYALDAAGENVPVDMTVEGATVKLSIDPGEADQYPILIDPIYETFSWGGAKPAEWESFSTDRTWMVARCCEFSDGFAPGIAARAQGLTYTPESDVHWVRSVPRYGKEEGKEPTSFIAGLTLSGVYVKGSSGPSSPYAYAGIWDTALNTWAGKAPSQALWAREGNAPNIIGGTISFTNGNDRQAQIAIGPGMHTNENASVGGPREMILGGATVEIGDEELPEVIKPSSSAIWSNQTAQTPIEATITDRDLGAKSAEFSLPGQQPFKTINSCFGNVAIPCPSEWRAFSGWGYNPAVMPQGWLSIPVWGEDVVGHKSAKPAYAEVGIDHTSPSLSPLTGTVTEQGTVGTHLLEYGLKINSTDGFEAPPTVQKTIVSSFNHPVGVAVDEKRGIVAVVDKENSRIKKFNLAGEYLATVGAPGSGNGQLAAPRMIAIDSAGNFWVTDYGNHRIEEFSSSGAYIRQFKDASLESPYGIAISPDGSIWVSNANEVVQIKESSGVLSIVKRVKGAQKVESGQPLAGKDTTFSTPTGLAADPSGNIWVADTGHHRLQEISSAGVVIRQIGSFGSERAQFNSPNAVAVTGLGHLLVADSGNNRLQVLDSEGNFLRFVTDGTTQLSNPAGIAVGPGNTAFVTDWGNNRVVKWGNVDLDSQSGVVKSEVLIDGIPRDVFKPTCSGEAVCAITNHEWTLKAREFAEGPHSLQVMVTDGVGLTTSSPELTVDLHPDRTPPQLTLSGSMTEQSTLGSTRPTYKLKVQGVDPEPKEGSLVFSSSVNSGNGTGFFAPADAAVDSKGNYWVADKLNNRLVKYGPTDSYIRSAGTNGSAGGQLTSPSGVATDPSGNVWVADTSNHRIQEFNENGSFVLAFGKDVNKTKVEGGGSEADRNICTAASGNVCKAGVAGSALGQLSAPRGIAVTSSGNIWVADTANNRLQKFSSSGTYLNKISLLGTEGQLKEPSGVAVGPDGSIWAADTGNNRVAEWNSSLAFVRQFGYEGTGNREFKGPKAIEVDSIGNVWVADQGNHRVKKFDPTGQFLIGYGTQQPTGDSNAFAPVGIGLDAQGGLYVADANNNRVQHWLPSASSQSGVVSSTIKVDGKSVDTYNPGCGTGNCVLTREWTLKSDSYTVGQHTVEVTVTDGSGLSSSKSMTMNVQRDATSPQVESTGPLAEAPEGWVEQKNYSFTATATDTNGYGVKQIRLLIDGTLVGESEVSSCEAGGCSKAKTFNVNAATYKGGAHEIAVIAEDGAGNWKKQTWTMNVDPQGAVGANEATDTLEAMEETVPPEEEFEPVASTDEFLEQQEIEAGDNPHFHWEEGKIVSSGVTVDTEIDPVAETLIMEGLQGPVELSPRLEASQPAVVENAAAVIPSTGVGADTVIRPEYSGAYMFTTIRDGAAPEEFAWHVHLAQGQYLTQLDPQHIAVISKTGAEAWTVSAIPARDATGEAVPTTLSILEGSDIVLKVPHRNAGYTYPISAGQSYVTEYAIVTVNLVEEQIAEEEEGAGANAESGSYTESEETSEGFNFNDPLSQAEQDDLNGYLYSGPGTHRNKEKPVPKRQARHMAHPQPLPRNSPLYRPSNPKEESGEIKNLNVGACSGFNCPIWEMALDKGTFKVTNRLAEWWSPAGCDYNVMDWWSWNLSVKLLDVGHRRNEVKRGSNEHITYWCKFNVVIYPLPDLLCMVNHFSLQEWVFPNGYTERHMIERNPPFYPQLPPTECDES